MNFPLKKFSKILNIGREMAVFKFWPEVKITRLIDILSAVF